MIDALAVLPPFEGIFAKIKSALEGLA